jgi:hypothetical protein
MDTTTCPTPVEGLVMQPYWLFIISQTCFTLLGIAWSAVGYDGGCFCSLEKAEQAAAAPSRGYFIIVACYHFAHFLYLVVISAAYSDNLSYWDNYQQFYGIFINSGVTTFAANCFFTINAADRVMFFPFLLDANKDNYISIDTLLKSLSAFFGVLMLPFLITHVIPGSLAYVSLVWLSLVRIGTFFFHIPTDIRFLGRFSCCIFGVNSIVLHCRPFAILALVCSHSSYIYLQLCVFIVGIFKC